MPCIASGSRFVYMDPLRSVFKGDAVQYKFDERSNKNLIKTHQDFASFSRLGGRYWKNGFTSGSLFKFTLRKEPSCFSTVCYDNERFEKLMEKFLDEAFLTLIFLKNVKKLKFFVIEENGNQLNEIYTINMRESSIAIERDSFQDRIKQHVAEKNFKTTEILNHTLQLVQQYRNKTQTFTYAISELFGFSGDNRDFVAMMTNDALSYVPLVSVALPIDCGDSDVGGHIFAALPLPLQVKCMTGMPVHVNGFFALGQDRKDLKWRTLTEGDVSNDITVNWNVCLITELLPIAYSNLVKYLITQYQNDNPSEVYKAWPCKGRVDRKWEIFLDKYYSIMFQEKCIYSSTSKKWVKINEVHFIDENKYNSKDQVDVITSLIVNEGRNVETVEPTITGSYRPEMLNWVNHSLVFDILKSNQSDYQKLPITDKTKVLQFLVKAPSDWNSLSGIKIIPFLNGSYGALNNSTATANMIMEKEIQSLLPTTERTLDDTIFLNGGDLLGTFKEWIQKGILLLVTGC